MIVTTDPDGEIRKTGDTYELVFRRRYAKPIEKVWAALTVPERIADWFTQVTFHPRVELGARIEVVFPETPDKIEPGEVIAFDPPRLLAWRWPFETAPAAIVRYELEADGDGCLLTFTHSHLGTHLLPNTGAGWHTFLEGLPIAIDGGRPNPWTEARENELLPRYRAQARALGALEQGTAR